jgi:hypothetical protein
MKFFDPRSCNNLMRPYVTVTARFLANTRQTSAVRSTNRTGTAGFVKPAGTTPADENHN